jgi:hypothetical protein
LRTLVHPDLCMRHPLELEMEGQSVSPSKKIYKLSIRVRTLLHKISPDMHIVKHKLVKNTLPCHHVKHDDTPVPPKCRRAEKQAISRHPG